MPAEFQRFCPYSTGMNPNRVTRTRYDPGASDTEGLSALVTRFVNDLAEKSGKKVVVAFRAPGDLAIPFKHKSALRNVMAQLVRNSIVHGIETPAERQVAGKPAEGHIWVAARQSNGNLEFLFSSRDEANAAVDLLRAGHCTIEAVARTVSTLEDVFVKAINER